MNVHDHYLAELAKAQHREAIRQCEPGAIAADLAAAGISMPFVEGAYRIGTRRVLDQSDVSLWFAVQTAPRMEEPAAAALRGLGHACRVPMRAYLRQTRKKDKQGKFIKERVEAPLCTGYAFLGIGSGAPDWRTICGRDGVQGVLGVGGSPEPIRRTAKLYAMFAADEAGAFDQAYEPEPWRPEAGDMASVVDSPFSGFVAQVVSCKGDAATIIINELFGGTAVTINLRHLVPA
jgi:transcription antitermination factor NusG